MVLSYLITKNSPVPLYYQIQEQIKDQILNGELSQNDQLPSERQLSEKLEVSRVTVRKAIRGLLSEGYCVKREGEGIFVAPGKYKIDIQNFRGYSEFALRNGVEPKTIVLEKETYKCSKAIAEKLAIQPDSLVLYLSRLRYLKEMPVLMETVWLPLERTPGLETYDFSQSLYRILRERYETFAHYGKGSLNIRVATQKHAKRFGVPINSPLMFKEVTVFTKEQVPIEYLHAYYRADIFEFDFESTFKYKRDTL
jgi:GntR family transcriptional regulator